MIRKMAEELRANKLTVEESKLLVQMRNAQRASGRVFQSGLPPIGGWPGNLWQLPHTDANGTTRWDYATDTPNFLEFARKINGIFQTLENTLTGLPCGARVNAAMVSLQTGGAGKLCSFPQVFPDELRVLQIALLQR